MIIIKTPLPNKGSTVNHLHSKQQQLVFLEISNWMDKH